VPRIKDIFISIFVFSCLSITPLFAETVEGCAYPCDPFLDRFLIKKHNAKPTVVTDKNFRINEVSDKDSKGVIIKLELADSKESTWNLTGTLAILAFFFSIITFLYSILNERKALSKSINDDFWMRTVTLPLAMEHVLDLVRKGGEEFRIADNDIRKFYDNFYLRKTDQLRASFLITSVIADSLPEELSDILDMMEDKLFIAVDEEQIAHVLSVFVKDVVTKFKQYQFRID
jgi:hypothetical protein